VFRQSSKPSVRAFKCGAIAMAPQGQPEGGSIKRAMEVGAEKLGNKLIGEKVGLHQHGTGHCFQEEIYVLLKVACGSCLFSDTFVSYMSPGGEGFDTSTRGFKMTLYLFIKSLFTSSTAVRRLVGLCV
jgi:hypothetical protein